ERKAARAARVAVQHDAARSDLTAVRSEGRTQSVLRRVEGQITNVETLTHRTTSRDPEPSFVVSSTAPRWHCESGARDSRSAGESSAERLRSRASAQAAQLRGSIQSANGRNNFASTAREAGTVPFAAVRAEWPGPARTPVRRAKSSNRS